MEKFNIKVDAEASLPGEAMTMLRTIAEMINRGEKNGPGWSLGVGEQEVQVATLEGKRNAELDALTDQLNRYLAAEYISDDELRVAQEQLLPPLYDALRNAGFGTDIFEDQDLYQFTKDWGDYEAGIAVTKETLGDGAIFKDLLDARTIVKVEGDLLEVTLVDKAQKGPGSDEKSPDDTIVDSTKNSTPSATQQATEDAGTVGKAVVAPNEPEKPRGWWPAAKK